MGVGNGVVMYMGCVGEGNNGCVSVGNDGFCVGNDGCVFAVHGGNGDVGNGAQ